MTTIYTDGSSRGNPGPGGFGAIVIAGSDVTEISGSEKHTTNNRMEMMAVIEGVRLATKVMLTPSEKIEVYSDSQYVIKGMTEWIIGWQKRDWIGSNKKPVLNRDLWEELLEVTKGLEVKYIYVKGHAGNSGNERADTLATDAATGVKTKLYKGKKIDYQFL